MSKRIYVGELPYSVTDSQLEEMFAKFGTVNSASVVTDKFTNQSKGFGFVEMDDVKAVDEAIKSLNDTELDGRKLAVNEANLFFATSSKSTAYCLSDVFSSEPLFIEN